MEISKDGQLEGERSPCPKPGIEYVLRKVCFIMKLPALKSGLVVTELADELLVYDSASGRAHCLGKVGMVVYRACEAGLDHEAATQQLGLQGFADPEAALQETLNQLSLESLTASDPNERPPAFDRRRFLEAAGALAALPVIASVLAPRPLQAMSCITCDAPGGVPANCSNCGMICVTVLGQTCTGTRICSFEYVLNTVPTPSGDPTAACASFRGLTGDTGGNYACRLGLVVGAYSPNNTFFSNCQVARQAVLSAGGTDPNGLVDPGGPGAYGPGNNPREGERYYCCQCDGTTSTYSCP